MSSVSEQQNQHSYEIQGERSSLDHCLLLVPRGIDIGVIRCVISAVVSAVVSAIVSAIVTAVFNTSAGSSLIVATRAVAVAPRGPFHSKSKTMTYLVLTGRSIEISVDK